MTKQKWIKNGKVAAIREFLQWYSPPDHKEIDREDVIQVFLKQKFNPLGPPVNLQSPQNHPVISQPAGV